MCYYNLARIPLSATKVAITADGNKRRLKFNPRDRTADKVPVCVTVGTVSESNLMPDTQERMRNISVHPFAQEHRREWTYLGIKFDFDIIHGHGSFELGQTYTTLPVGAASCKHRLIFRISY
jgi:hypothetical protein